MQYTFSEGRSSTGSNYAFLKPAEALSPASGSLSWSLWQLGKAQCSRVRFLHWAWLPGFCLGTWRTWSRRAQTLSFWWEGSALTLQVRAAADAPPVPSERLLAPWVCLHVDLVARWIHFSASGGHFSQCSNFKICTEHISKGWFQIPSKSAAKFRFTSVGTVAPGAIWVKTGNCRRGIVLSGKINNLGKNNVIFHS